MKELESFIDSKQKVLNSVLGTLGWTEESVKDEVRCFLVFSNTFRELLNGNE